MKTRTRVIFFLIGLVGIAILILSSDFESINWELIFNKQFYVFFSLLIGLWIGIYALRVCVYKVILGKEKKKVPFFSMLKTCISGFALNNVTPAGFVGGEPYRIMELQRYLPLEKATSVSFSFTIVYIASQFLIWFLGSVYYYILRCPGELVTTIIMSIAAIVSLSVVCLIVFGNRHNFVEGVVKLFSHIPLVGKYIGKFYESKKEKLNSIDKDIAAFRKEPVKLLSALFIEFIARLAEGFEYYCILSFLGLSINPAQGILIYSSASLMGNILFFIPMQIGGRESGMSIGLSWFTQNTSFILPACLIYRMRDLACTTIGVFCILLSKKKN